MCDFDLQEVKSDLSSNAHILDYTYKYATLQAQSYIDYFIVIINLMSSIQDFDIMDCGSNMSDHNVIVVKVVLEFCKSKVELNNKSVYQSKPVQRTLRWDHANTSEYYHRTFIDSKEIHDKLNVAYDDLLKHEPKYALTGQLEFVFCQSVNLNVDVVKLVEDNYSHIVNVLVNAANFQSPAKNKISISIGGMRK